MCVWFDSVHFLIPGLGLFLFLLRADLVWFGYERTGLSFLLLHFCGTVFSLGGGSSGEESRRFLLLILFFALWFDIMAREAGNARE